jgi:hypothetical protein
MVKKIKKIIKSLVTNISSTDQLSIDVAKFNYSKDIKKNVK